MKGFTFILSILIFISTVCCGQNDHLEPAKDISEYEGQLKEYYDGIFKLLYQDLSKKPIAKYTVLPSFSSEYVMSLEKEKADSYKLIVRICSANYWYAENKKSVKIKVTVKPINKDLTQAIKKLFDKATGQIKRPPDKLAGLDGETYYFSTTTDGGQLITGEKWSPEQGSKMEKLVQICEDLISFTYDKGKSSVELIEDINKLIIELD